MLANLSSYRSEACYFVIKHTPLHLMRIKHYLITVSIAMFALISFGLLSGCVKSNQGTGTPPVYSIFKLVNSSSNLTQLDTALIKTGLDSVFNQMGSYTFFVATDAAWTAAGLTDAVVNSLSDSQLNNIILYSTLNQGIATAQFPAGPNAKEITLSGDSLFVTNNSTGVFVNGIGIVAADLLASNGLIDALNQQLVPPAGTIMQYIQADTLFSYFSAALARTAAGLTNVGQILSSGNIYTVFLPTNDAFRAAGFMSVDSIATTNPDSLAQIMIYHIVPGRVFTSDFSTGLIENTLLTNYTLELTLLGGQLYTVQGSGNLSPVYLNQANIMAHNGVVHVISQLILP
jgi:uncharacterized surface protein with fasciclin (FAS1) repeats